MASLKAGRPHDLLRWLILLLVIAVVGLLLWFRSERNSLACASEGEGAWRLTYVDGDGVSKFMWAIQPQDSVGFLSCLEAAGYEVTEDTKSGEVTAVAPGGVIIANTIGDDFVRSGTFYRW